jgi:hypothetical protein
VGISSFRHNVSADSFIALRKRMTVNKPRPLDVRGWGNRPPMSNFRFNHRNSGVPGLKVYFLKRPE